MNTQIETFHRPLTAPSARLGTRIRGAAVCALLALPLLAPADADASIGSACKSMLMNFAGATIASNGRVNGKWSNPALWTGGVVPGATDTANFTNLSAVVYDADAPGAVTAISANALRFTLERDITAQNLYLREVTLSDGGHTVTVDGTFSNYLIDGYEGNGGTRIGQGGNLIVGNLALGRAAQYTFFPGDTVRGNYTTHRIRNAWPDIAVSQTAAYSNRLDQGLSLSNATGSLSLGRTSATDQAEITLNWDTALTGDIDWTLRWAGDHVAALRAYHANNQIKIGTLPTAVQAFDPNRDIFFDATTNYSYVGFRTADIHPYCPINQSFFVSASCTETPSNTACCVCPPGTKYVSVSAGYRQCKN